MVCILCNFYILNPVPIYYSYQYLSHGEFQYALCFSVLWLFYERLLIYVFFPVQDFNALVRYLNQFSPDQFLTAMSNFHLLVFLATCDMLPLKVSTASR